MARLYPYRLTVLVAELASAVLTPWCLGVVLPRQAGAIADFFANDTVNRAQFGDVCRSAAFDPATVVNLSTGAPSKLEVSVARFGQQYPQWTPATEWQSAVLANSVDTMRRSVNEPDVVYLQ